MNAVKWTRQQATLHNHKLVIAVKDTDAPHCPRLPYAMLVVLVITCTDLAQVSRATGKQRIQDGL